MATAPTKQSDEQDIPSKKSRRSVVRSLSWKRASKKSKMEENEPCDSPEEVDAGTSFSTTVSSAHGMSDEDAEDELFDSSNSKKRKKTGVWKAMKRFFSRKSGKGSKSFTAGDTHSPHGVPQRSASDPNLVHRTGEKADLAPLEQVDETPMVTEVSPIRALSHDSLLSELRSKQRSSDSGEETSPKKKQIPVVIQPKPSDVDWQASPSSTPERLLPGLNVSHDKIRVAPRHRRAPTRKGAASVRYGARDVTDAIPRSKSVGARIQNNVIVEEPQIEIAEREQKALRQEREMKKAIEEQEREKKRVIEEQEREMKKAIEEEQVKQRQKEVEIKKREQEKLEQQKLEEQLELETRERLEKEEKIKREAKKHEYNVQQTTDFSDLVESLRPSTDSKEINKMETTHVENETTVQKSVSGTAAPVALYQNIDIVEKDVKIEKSGTINEPIPPAVLDIEINAGDQQTIEQSQSVGSVTLSPLLKSTPATTKEEILESNEIVESTPERSDEFPSSSISKESVEVDNVISEQPEVPSSTVSDMNNVETVEKEKSPSSTTASSPVQSERFVIETPEKVYQKPIMAEVRANETRTNENSDDPRGIQSIKQSQSADSPTVSSLLTNTPATTKQEFLESNEVKIVESIPERSDEVPSSSISKDVQVDNMISEQPEVSSTTVSDMNNVVTVGEEDSPSPTAASSPVRSKRLVIETPEKVYQKPIMAEVHAKETRTNENLDGPRGIQRKRPQSMHSRIRPEVENKKETQDDINAGVAKLTQAFERSSRSQTISYGERKKKPDVLPKPNVASKPSQSRTLERNYRFPISSAPSESQTSAAEKSPKKQSENVMVVVDDVRKSEVETKESVLSSPTKKVAPKPKPLPKPKVKPSKPIVATKTREEGKENVNKTPSSQSVTNGNVKMSTKDSTERHTGSVSKDAQSNLPSFWARRSIFSPEQKNNANSTSTQDTSTKSKEVNKHAPFIVPQTDTCAVCGAKVYQMEKFKVKDNIVHRNCIKCSVCKRLLSVGNFIMSQNKIYCKPHEPHLTVSLATV